MKTFKLLIILVILKVARNIDVERYIEMLKSNQYDSSYLPNFTYQDIPALLKYRNETRMITNYPHNPISSLYMPDCKLGMYVLWTIESIRAVAINSKYLIGNFPSQNPILCLRNVSPLTWVYDSKSHEIIAEAYNDWWGNNQLKGFDAFKYLDPLENTEYRW